MSSSRETRSRLFLEELEKLAEWLSSDAPRAPAALEEKTVRLLAMAVTLLRQHPVGKRGKCQFCGWTGWTWRLWRRRQRCTIHQALDFGMGQSLDVVWWRVFESVGRKRSLAEVRAWMTERTTDAGATVPAELLGVMTKTSRRSCWELLPIETSGNCVEWRIAESVTSSAHPACGHGGAMRVAKRRVARGCDRPGHTSWSAPHHSRPRG